MTPRFGLTTGSPEHPAPVRVSPPGTRRHTESVSLARPAWHTEPVTASTETGNSRPKPIGSGRSGPVRAALTRAVDEARRSGRMTTEHEVTGLLAQRVAALVDLHAAQCDGDRMLKAAANLRELMDTLPIRNMHGEAREEGSGDGDSGRGQLLRLMDSPPTVGDSAHS